MTQNNVDTVRQAHEAFSRGDLDSAQQLVADNCRLIDHGRGETHSGRDAFRGWMQGFRDTSSNMQIVDNSYIDAGNTVIAQFRAVGVQDGPMEPFPASNKPYTLDVCEVWHFDDSGQAIEGHNYSDGLGLLMQLGHIPAPEVG